MDDNRIIELFFERSEQAVTELSAKYGRVCMSVAANVLNDRCDAEECVNDALYAVWNTIPPKKPDSLIAYVCRIARNLSVNRFKRNSAQKRGGARDLCISELDECLPSGDAAEERFETKELSRLIDEYLDGLDRTNRMLFVRRYWYMDSFEKLAKTAGLSAGAVRTRLTRMRGALREFLESRGVDV